MAKTFIKTSIEELRRRGRMGGKAYVKKYGKKKMRELILAYWKSPAGIKRRKTCKTKTSTQR